ncbi:MAG: DUF1592 domain-containing protein [Deltaproteobacteria bacterium]|nr:DUF1592 domain-containing protein [Deltaproteobacteria bacterium]
MAIGTLLSTLALGAGGGCYSGVRGFDPGPDLEGADDGANDGEIDEPEELEELDPGRVVMRRLTNTEYDNTIRDLLFGLDVSPSADFPADEVSLGFDNIGNVLSVTPVLFELYERAAEQTLELALTSNVGEPDRQEAETVGGSAGDVCCGGFWNLSTNGEIATTFAVETDGLHEIAVRAYGQQAGPDLPHMVISVDGAIVTEFDVSATIDAPAEHLVTTELDAGEHVVTVAFTNDYYDQLAAEDRNLYIDWTELRPQDGESSAVRDKILTCDPVPGDEAACAEQILSTFGRRAWRRPLEADELAGLLALFQTTMDEGQGFDTSISQSLEAILVSPYFLFRVEIDPDPGSLVPHPVSDYELATRLSYLVWSSMPDDQLLDLAQDGALSDPEQLEAQVRRMLQDDRARALVANFAGQWLYLRTLAEPISKDYDTFPEFDPQLQDSMRTESEMFVQTFLTEGRSLRELLTGDDTFIDARLAEHYGLPAPQGDGFSRISLEGVPRRGLLMQAGLMSVLSHSVTTSPVKRGKWVLEQLMCLTPPPPPPGVEAPPEDTAIGGTMREQLEQHRADPTCAACHSLMDPIGLGLEHFDAIGRYRDADAGQAIDASGTLPNGAGFDDAVQMVDHLAVSDEFVSCVARKALTYALGRGPGISDIPYVQEIATELDAGDMTFEELLIAIVRSETFRMRRGEEQ